jgi:hypothetical protein
LTACLRGPETSALAESRDRLLRLVTADRIRPATSSPPSNRRRLSYRFLRRHPGRRGRTPVVASKSGRQAAELLSPEAVQAPHGPSTFDFFERSSVWDAAPERFRLRGVATGAPPTPGHRAGYGTTTASWSRRCCCDIGSSS